MITDKGWLRSKTTGRTESPDRRTSDSTSTVRSRVQMNQETRMTAPYLRRLTLCQDRFRRGVVDEDGTEC